MTDRVVYLMRGLPSCGKSYTARQLAGTSGVVLETDEYFFTQVGSDRAQYDYREELLPQARQWNFERFVSALAAGASPVVVDRGNGLNAQTRQYAAHAVREGYRVELQEPTSPWWQEIRALLKNQAAAGEALDEWAQRLAAINRQTHRVPSATIRHWMASWRHDLSVAQILGCGAAQRLEPRICGTGSDGN